MTEPARAAIDGRGPRIGFTMLLFAAMGVATFVAGVLSVVSSDLIDEFGISREQFGFLITAIFVAGGLFSPFVGRVTDAIGGRAAIVVLFALSAAAYGVFSIAPVYGVVALGGVLGAVSNALANPSTNKLIAIHIALGRRAVITGVKQSGVQATIFVGGLFLPNVAARFGWRAAPLVVAAVSLAVIPVAIWLIPRDEPRRRTGRTVIATSPFVWWLAVYGFILGFAGAVTFLIPLFVEEQLGRSADMGGTALAMVGLSAFVGRIVWARIAERRARYELQLGLIAVASMAAGFVMLAVSPETLWLLWIGVAFIGLSSSSWNSVGMLAVMDRAGAAQAGGASGIVLTGFLTGMGIAPPLYGRTVDQTGSYDQMWWISIGLALAGTLWTAGWMWLAKRRQRAASARLRA